MKIEHMTERKRFSIVARAKSFTHAWRGIYIFIKSTHNAWVHLAFFFILVLLGLFFKITPTEWVLLIISSSLLIIIKAINTAIEIDINLTSPNYHPYARDTKDVAAGAVLIASLMTLMVTIIVFVPYFINFIK